MNNHHPLPLTSSEWNELALQDTVRHVYSITATVNPGKALSHVAYGAKFNVGPMQDVYVLLHATSNGSGPEGHTLVVARTAKNTLEVVH